MTQCVATTKAGRPCESVRVRATGYCWYHDPTIVAERTAKSRLGGQNHGKTIRALTQRMAERPLTVDEIIRLLDGLAAAVMAEALSPQIASAISSLMRTRMEARSVALLEQLARQVNALEAHADAPTPIYDATIVNDRPHA